MKKLIFILFLLFTFSCKKENSSVENSNNWQIYTDVKYFPISIIKFLEALYGRDFKLANPNENFNITDVKVYPNKPHQQLCFLANKENIWRLVYIQGGVGKSNKFYEFEVNKDTRSFAVLVRSTGLAHISSSSAFSSSKNSGSMTLWIFSMLV